MNALILSRLGNVSLSILTMVALGLAVLGCNEIDNGQGSAMVAVQKYALSTSEVDHITITVSGPNISPDIVRTLDENSVNGLVATIENIPAGENRNFVAHAFGADGALLYSGMAENVSVDDGQTVLVNIYLQQIDPPLPFENAVPQFDSLVLSHSKVAPSHTVNITAAASDPNDETLTWSWGATCGTFSNTESPVTTWTAPNTEGLCTLNVTVTDPKDASASISFDIDVQIHYGKGGVEFQVNFNSWPIIQGLKPSLSRIDIGETTHLNLTAFDSDGDTLYFSWTSDCDGTYSDNSIEDPSFTLNEDNGSGDCILDVSVSDNRGGSNTAQIILRTGQEIVIEVSADSDTNTDTGGCLIDSIYYEDGQLNPNNQCQVCRSNNASNNWINAEDGSDCELDSRPCSVEKCNSGICVYEVTCPVFVDESATGAATGASWEDAFTTIQEGVASAIETDNKRVFVAEGTYNPTTTFGPYNDYDPILTMENGVEIYGSFDTDDNLLEDRQFPLNLTTVLDGRHVTPNVVIGASDAKLDGLKVINGYKPRHNGQYAAFNDGAGMYNKDVSNLTISNVTFASNRTCTQLSGFYGNGGGLYNDNSQTVVTDVTFINNSAFNPGGPINGDGGGMYNTNSSVAELTNVTFIDNYANDKGAAIANTGGSTISINQGSFSCALDSNCIYDDGNGTTIVNSVFYPINSGIPYTEQMNYNLLNVCVAETNGSDLYQGDNIIIINSNPFEISASRDKLFLKQNSTDYTNPCIDTASVDAANAAYGVNGWEMLTTSIDGTQDSYSPDMGAHYLPHDITILSFYSDIDVYTADILIHWEIIAPAGSTCTITAPGNDPPVNYDIPNNDIAAGTLDYIALQSDIEVTIDCISKNGQISMATTTTVNP